MKTPCHGDIIERSCDMYRNMVIYSIMYVYIYIYIDYSGVSDIGEQILIIQALLIVVDFVCFDFQRFSTNGSVYSKPEKTIENPQKKTSSSSTAMIKVLANWSPRYHSCFIKHGIQRCPKNHGVNPFFHVSL